MRGEQKPDGPGGDQPPPHSNIMITLVTAPRICPHSCASRAQDLTLAPAASTMCQGSSTPSATGLEAGAWGKR